MNAEQGANRTRPGSRCHLRETKELVETRGFSPWAQILRRRLRKTTWCGPPGD